MWTTTEAPTMVVCERTNWKTCPEHKHLSASIPSKLDFKLTKEELNEAIESMPSDVSLEAYEDSIANDVYPDDEDVPYMADDLLSFGVDSERVNDIFNRKDLSGITPTEEQVKVRVKFLLAEMRVASVLKSLKDKKWGLFSSEDEKKTYYKNTLDEIISASSSLNSSWFEVRTSEGYTPSSKDIPELLIKESKINEAYAAATKCENFLKYGKFN